MQCQRCDLECPPFSHVYAGLASLAAEVHRVDERVERGVQEAKEIAREAKQTAQGLDASNHRLEQELKEFVHRLDASHYRLKQNLKELQLRFDREMSDLRSEVRQLGDRTVNSN